MNKYDYIFLGGIILWVVETACFGWNREPQSTPELVLDRIAFVLMGYGAFMNLLGQFRPAITVNVNNKTNLTADDSGEKE